MPVKGVKRIPERVTDPAFHQDWIGELWRCRKYHKGVGTRETCKLCWKECCKKHRGSGDETTCPVCANQRLKD